MVARWHSGVLTGSIRTPGPSGCTITRACGPTGSLSGACIPPTRHSADFEAVTEPNTADNSTPDTTSKNGQVSGRPTPTRDGLLSRELGGDLPCIGCGYNLRGLSIRSMCPECGVAVRATILRIVDPQASELQPINSPRLVATGVVLWGIGAAMAGVLSWLPHVADLLSTLLAPFNFPFPSRPNVAQGILLGIVVSGIGSIALWRPHHHIELWKTVAAVIGTTLYVPLVYSEWRYFMTGEPPHYLAGYGPSGPLTRWFVLSAALISLIVIATRPMARLLVARSLAMRTGRVDRQTLLAMAAAAALMVAGGLFVGAMGFGTSPFAGAPRIIGMVAITFGGLLLTIGLVGSLADSLRIAQAIVYPRPTLRQVIRGGASTPKTRLGRILDPTLPRETKP